MSAILPAQSNVCIDFCATQIVSSKGSIVRSRENDLTVNGGKITANVYNKDNTKFIQCIPGRLSN